MLALKRAVLVIFLTSSAASAVLGLIVIWVDLKREDVSWSLFWSAILLMMVSAIVMSVLRTTGTRDDV